MKNYSHCPVCGHEEFKDFIECEDYTVSKETFKIVQCKKCNFAFTNPVPQEKDIAPYYQSEEYISHSNTSKGLVNSLYQSVRSITLNQKSNLLKRLGAGKNILDIGCGTGEFLNHCKKKGYQVTGIEPSAKARKQVQNNFQIPVEEEAALSSMKSEQFDFITLWHVLEHIYPLKERIEEIKRLLKKDGRLIVAVPNRNSYDASYYKEYWAAYDVPRHLYHFRPKDIDALFGNNGFQLKEIQPMRFDSFYVSMLSEKYKTGSTNLMKAFMVGLKSNIKGRKGDKYSSQIYVITKTG